jgi:Ala-tRNA(Pro) deacylase
MPTLHRILSYLDSHRIAYVHDPHPVAYTAREVASAEHVPERMMAKAVVFLTENGYGMAVLAADTYVDMADLRAALGATRMRLATETELRELFPNCELGAMPPFGNGTLYDLPVYADRVLASQENIAFNAGTHRDCIRLRWADYFGLVRPTVMAFAHQIAHASA